MLTLTEVVFFIFVFGLPDLFHLYLPIYPTGRVTDAVKI